MSKNKTRDEVIKELLEVNGIGEAYAEEMFDSLKIDSIETLIQAAKDNKLTSISGVGAKKQAAILNSAEEMFNKRGGDSKKTPSPDKTSSAKSSKAKGNTTKKSNSKKSKSTKKKTQKTDSGRESLDAEEVQHHQSDSDSQKNNTIQRDTSYREDDNVARPPGFDDPLPVIFVKIAYEFSKQETKKVARKVSRGVTRSVSKIFSIFSKDS